MMPLEHVGTLQRIFDELDPERLGELETLEVLEALLGRFFRAVHPEKSESGIPSVLSRAPCDGQLTMPRVLQWLLQNAFAEELMVSPEQLKLRASARRWNASICQVEDLHEKFERFDTDKTGCIEFGEFKRLVHVLIKAPANVELPASRLSFFWGEIDRSGDGVIAFDEFFFWYRKYFSSDSESQVLSAHLC